VISCWSVKGGSGTSVVSAMLALALSRHAETVLVDVEGDQPGIFGVAAPSAGFRDWWNAEVGADALLRLAVAVSPRLRLVGAGDATAEYADRQIDVIPELQTIFDAGTVRDDRVAAHIVEASAKSLLVLRPCYLAARRASMTPLRVDGLVVIEEHGRALGSADLAEVVGAPVLATIPWDLSIARTIDAGRLGNKVPRVARPLEALAVSLLAEVAHAS
jgi:hypothetical protein